MDLFVEDAGHGDPPIVMVHAGIADRRMWEREFGRLSAWHHVVRYDVRGFGRSPDPAADYFDHVDLLDVMSAHGLDRAVLVGSSNGGRIVLDAAVTAPSRVTAMVLLAPALPGIPASDQLAGSFRDEERALRNGDIATAREINLALWVDGVGRSGADPRVRATVGAWLDDLLPRQAAQLTSDRGDAQLVEPLVRDRLDEVDIPTLVVVGAHDQRRIHAAAQHLVDGVVDGHLAVVDDAAHLPNLEAPAVVDQLMDDFLGR